MKPYFPIYDEKRVLEEDFPGHSHEIKAFPPRTSDIPQESGRTLGRARAPRKKHHQTKVGTLEDPATRAEIPKEIGRDIDVSLHVRD